MKLVEERTCFMIGMPSSGKTTYLVSLANMLISGEQTTLLSLKNSDTLEGMENIQTEIENFNRFQKVGRTFRTVGGWVKIPLFDEQGKKTWLRIPDLSGEVFVDLIWDRRLKKDVVTHLQAADMLLFFLNIDTMTKDQRIPLGEEVALGIIEEKYSEEVIKSGKVRSAEIETDRKKRVTQADIVELLQCVLYLTRKRISIKFVISAWDSIEKQLDPENQVPEECMEKFLPLLFQFLHSNLDRVDSEIWGVSAQGFDFTNQEELEKWKMDDIWEHSRVITPAGEETHDLTRLFFMN